MSEQPGPGGALVPLPDLDADGRAAFTHGGREYAVFTLDGQVVVTDGACPHKGGPLAEGLVRDGAVRCPWHWYTFDLATGVCRSAESAPLRRHEVLDVDGRPHARVVPPATVSLAERLRAHARGED
ncbi:Rieske (2Fe-2S) protein [Kineosporia sp. R_H_3]|uniref:Rieske (2Fe-2S) protein n=1 Tax=Kineosporia sp. R_H_3 TaxID=1961848 RepID=UPI000B4AE640|nr:Rieske (2Fe-2S) protein [Kineosporia sp. R_H_3]